MNAEEGTTVFLTSHDAGDVEHICRRAIIVNHGVIVCDAPIAQLKRDHLRTRLIQLTFSEPTPGVAVEGARVRQIDPLRATVEVEIDRTPIDVIVGYLVGHYPVIDIAVAEPPMEEVIAAIYGQREPEPTLARWSGRLVRCPDADHSSTAMGGRISRSRA